MAKQKKVRTPKQVENRKKVFHFLESMAMGAIKFWLNGKKIILPIEEVDDFLKSQIDNIER